MSKSITVLIDGETISPSFAAQIFTHASSLGSVAAREIYGSGTALAAWTEAILEHAVNASFTPEGNAVCALVIGAVEIAQSLQPAEGDGAVFLIAANADLSALAVYLRKKGFDVIGMGEGESVSPFRTRACTAFEPLAASRPAEESAPDPSPAQYSGSEKEAPAPAEKPAAEVPQAASTHRVRLSIIRQIISAQIAENGGRIRSRDLFKALAADPNYQVDQRKSRRNPLDYLKTQFDAWFVFEAGEKGTCWISAKRPSAQTAPSAGSPSAEEKTAPSAEAAPVPEPPAGPVPAVSEEKAAPVPGPVFPIESQDISSEVLTNLGIPLIHADRAAELIAGCVNMRGVYNAMRKAFGNDLGKKYHEILKTIPIVFPDPGPAEKEEDDSARPLTREEIGELTGASRSPAETAQPDASPSAEAVSVPETAPELSETPDPEEREEQGTDAALRLSSGPVRFLLERGVTSDNAVRIVKIYYDSPNQRIAYNELRKAFGNKGGQYLKMMKEYEE